MSILRRIFPFLLTAALLCACVQMPNTPQDVLPATTPQPTAAPTASSSAVSGLPRFTTRASSAPTTQIPVT